MKVRISVKGSSKIERKTKLAHLRQLVPFLSILILLLLLLRRPPPPLPYPRPGSRSNVKPRVPPPSAPPRRRRRWAPFLSPTDLPGSTAETIDPTPSSSKDPQRRFETERCCWNTSPTSLREGRKGEGGQDEERRSGRGENELGRRWLGTWMSVVDVRMEDE